jgi:hypothetical protein
MPVKLLKKKNYLAIIENAAKGENHMFRNLYAEIDGREKDILENGGLSCAVFVSSVLYLHKLIRDLHANVGSTEQDLKKSGWIEIREIKPGAVLVWEKKNGHKHVGFYLDNETAISNDSLAGYPRKHHFTYNNTRKIEKMYWHKEIDD